MRQAVQPKPQQSQIQLKQLDEGNFSQFVDLLRYRDWTPDTPVSEEMPVQHAQEMAQMTVDPSSGCAVWLIHDQQSLQAVGVITIMPVFHIGCRQLGYWVLPEYHGQGFATLAVRAITQLCFEQLNVSRLQAQTTVENLASARVLEKAGYEQEALLRASHQVNGAAVDAYIYAKIKE